MKTTLTALLAAGAVALSGCQYDVETDKGERIRSRVDGNYRVTVTDQERRRIAGALPREVRLDAEDYNVTPFRVVGRMDNALARNEQFSSGYIRYVYGDQKDCSWGPQVVSPLCTPAEVKNAQQMLTTYSAFAPVEK